MRTAAGEQRFQATPVSVFRFLLPYVVAVALVAVVLWRLDLGLLVEHLASVNYVLFIGAAVVFSIGLLLLDTLATANVYRRLVGPLSFNEFLLVRGASYLPALLNHHLGQAWITYYLSKVFGRNLRRVVSATLVIYATTLGCLFLLSAMALVLEPSRFPWLREVLVGVLVACALYGAVLLLRPRVLRDQELTAPLLELGIRGHLSNLLWRLPHMLWLFLGTWLPFWFFGVRIPLVDALVLIPPLMVLVALPITPQGIGTRDAFATQLLAAFAVGTVLEQRTAVAAATLGWAGALILVQLPLAILLARRVAARGVGQKTRAVGCEPVAVVREP